MATRENRNTLGTFVNGLSSLSYDDFVESLVLLPIVNDRVSSYFGVAGKDYFKVFETSLFDEYKAANDVWIVDEFTISLRRSFLRIKEQYRQGGCVFYFAFLPTTRKIVFLFNPIFFDKNRDKLISDFVSLEVFSYYLKYLECGLNIKRFAFKLLVK